LSGGRAGLCWSLHFAARPARTPGDEPMANVLIVDDDVDGCKPLARLLQVVGHSTFFVHDGRAALSLLDRVRPDMILLDMMMPGVDGIEVLKIIRAHPIHKNLPVIVYSALSDAGTVDAALKSGAQSYLVKSKAGIDEIENCIEAHLGSNN
jgi:CheY-like chemotaxis protein